MIKHFPNIIGHLPNDIRHCLRLLGIAQYYCTFAQTPKEDRAGLHAVKALSEVAQRQPLAH